MCDLLLVVLAHQPFVEVQARGATNGDGITIEEIGDKNQVAIGGELVSDQLGILEPVAQDISQTISVSSNYSVATDAVRRDRQNDCFLGSGTLGSLLVDFKVINGDEVASRVAVMLDALEAALSRRVGGHCDVCNWGEVQGTWSEGFGCLTM